LSGLQKVLSEPFNRRLTLADIFPAGISFPSAACFQRPKTINHQAGVHYFCAVRLVAHFNRFLCLQVAVMTCRVALKSCWLAAVLCRRLPGKTGEYSIVIHRLMVCTLLLDES